MRHYKLIGDKKFNHGEYSLVPLRDEDKYLIMKWRNEQMYHLRQQAPLTQKSQEKYFAEVVSGLFEVEYPNQFLFSFLENGKCIGYGGLVHFNWNDKNAEISFIMDTQLEKEDFHKNWSIYLPLIEKVAFSELKINKIYVYAFDLRPHLYSALESNGYFFDARLNKHVLHNNDYIDVLIYSKLCSDYENSFTC